MIDEDRTLQLYGYTGDELKPHSHKFVAVVCEECGRHRVTRRQDVTDLCKSCAQNGRAVTKETRHRISQSLLYKKKSISTRYMMRLGQLGKPKPWISGDKNPSWKGGITPWRKHIWHTQAYKNWRAAVFERDDYTCQKCSERGGRNLQAHHIHMVKDNKNTLLIFDISNGITLCDDCHHSIRGREEKFITQFETIIRGK